MSMHHARRTTLASLAVLTLGLTALLTGCASPTTREGMTPGDLVAAKKHPQTVSVAVTGGQETNPLWKSQVSNTSFAEALSDAITRSKVFSAVMQGKGGNYQLDVVLVSMTQPSFGASFTVSMEAGWSLRRTDSGAVVWQASVKSKHTARAGDAFVGTERLRLATEGAAKNNIKQGLEQISSLNL